ncbi:MAG: SpoIID/LytB domain-containing protein [Syntrophomonadaceae bacterium]|nr:SpoIID/LytB domain-containing protein [Syntrophomonadaceae bacterium]
MPNKHRNLWLVLLSLFLVLSICGCAPKEEQAPTKKPQLPKANTANLADEVEKYQGQEPTISLYRKSTGAKQQLKLEQYIKGVVAAEIGDKFPMEALKAQAIVARTMTLALLEYENGTRGKYNTDASDDHTEFQAYDEKRITERIAKAVDETRGEVLTYQGKFAYALFSSVSGTKTASIEEGFPKLKDKAGYLVPVETNGISIAPEKYRNWTVKVPLSEVRNIMGSKAGDLSDIKIGKKGPSGRALTITAGEASIPAVDLREKIGFDRLYSTYFTNIKAEGNNIIFKGSGWGHGVGMEQWGAQLMADKGKNAREIVQHYFPRLSWLKLYD